jgi:hypothetical protein
MQDQNYTYLITTKIMATNFSPVFALIPETKTALITGTTTDKSGATLANMVDLVVAAADGTKITWIKFKHVGTSILGQYLIWITDTAGANPRLYQEIQITAIASSVSIAAHEGSVFIPDLQLKSGQKIIVGSTTAGSNIHVTSSIGELG